MNSEFLSSCIHGRDLLNDDCVAGHYDADELARRATTVVQYGFAALKLEQILIKRKAAQCVRTTPHAVVLRGLNRLIRQATQIRPSDRDTIIRRLTTVLQEGVPLLMFNLHLNEAKTHTIARPLQTRRSQIISGASPALHKFRESISEIDQSSRLHRPRKVREPESVVRTFVNDIKVASTNGGAGYEDVSPYIIGSISSTLEILIAGFPSAPAEVRKDAELCEQVRSGDVPNNLPRDTRIRAAVIADPALTVAFTKSTLSSIDIPMQVWRSEAGAKDRGIDPEGVARVLNALPGQPEVHVVPAGHFAFLSPCSPELAANLPRFCTDPPDFDRAAFHRDFDASVLRFFREHL